MMDDIMLGQGIQQNLISTGNETLDKFLGGGFLKSTVNIFERRGPSSRILDSILNKSIICTTLSKKDAVLYVNFNTVRQNTVDEVLSGLPANRRVKSEILYKDVRGTTDTSKIKIAWRYSKSGISSPSDAFHKLNQVDFGLSLRKELEPANLGHLEILNIKPNESLKSILTNFEKAISEMIIDHKRVVVLIKDILHPFSPLTDKRQDLLNFMYLLRCLSRKLDEGAIVLGYDSDMCPEHEMIKQQIYNLVDSVVTFHSYETEDNKLTGYRDIDGTLNYVKVSKINSYGFHFQQDLSDWGYRLTKNYRHFVVDELSLPPCEDDINVGLQCRPKPQSGPTKIENFPRSLLRANPLEEFREVAKDILPRQLS